MKRKIFALLLCMVFICTLSLPVYADSTDASSDGYSVLISDIPTTCPTCGGSLSASWASTSGAEVEVQISESGSIKIPAGAGSFARVKLRCKSCGYEKSETRLLGLDFGNEKPGNLHVEQAPSGIGRKDLPGYADDKGSALVDKDGWPTATYTMLLDGYDTSAGVDTVYKHSTSNNGSWFAQITGSFSGSNGNLSVYGIYDSSSSNNNKVAASVSYYLIAPVSGYYTLNTTSVDVSFSVRDISGNFLYGPNDDYLFNTYCIFSKGVGFGYNFIGNLYPKSDLLSWHLSPASNKKLYFSKGDIIFFSVYSVSYRTVRESYPYKSISIKSIAPTLTVQDLTPNQITNNNNITINNNTWNGNIYVDNSTNLTYIYPQYTTINEKNETVTNISNTPIIYNNETKKYYTYDTITNNYYYITYEQPTAPTPSPNPKPTWKPGGGSTRGGGTGRYPADSFTADWTLNYYILNNRRYDAYYALKRTEVDTKNNIPWIDDKHYISTTQIPIANGEYTISVPDGVYWRVWQWDEASKTLTGVNSSNWHGNNFTFLFNTTDEYIFEFCKSDGSEFSSPKDVVLKLKNEKITEYEPGDTIVEEPSPSPTPSPINPPSPSPTPAPTDKPGGGTNPTPVPTPDGGTVPAPGGDSNISGGDDEGLFGWLWDLLKDLVKAILKAIFKILSNILGFLIWIVERVGLLLPFLPAPAIAALGAGVVLIFVIRIIRFIRG